jgi:hypothetical protein
MKSSPDPKLLRRRILKIASLVVFILVLAFASFDVILIKYPGVAAQGVDFLRPALGDKLVSQIETITFQAEDIFHQLKYQIAREPPSAPWDISPVSTPVWAGASTKHSAKTVGKSPVTNLLNNQASVSPSQKPDVATVASLPPWMPSSTWELPTITPLGTMQGEGQWSPYLYDPSSQVVAERTFLQPDPQRPYALVAVVAFDLSKVHLNFVPGYQEPKSTVQMARPGSIPPVDMAPGILVAAFNGGFKAEHGHFGVMTNNVTLIPPRDGLGTVGIYSDGTVKIGAWGSEVQPSPSLITWRQNGPLIVHNGVVNPHTADNAPQDWGYTVGGSITTSRSAMGISQDGRTLFYAAGTDLTLPSLARAVQAAGAYQAIQLDINNYYVHFEAIQFDGNVPHAVTLLDSMRGPGDQRFLKAEPRDFFFITLR